ncbi:hypothetical protein ACA910_012646 [Epithemia clementina (nom. ined.)]
MDVDVEMVDSRREAQKDDIVAAENFRDTEIVDNPIVRRQNICFLIAMFSCVVGFSVYVVGRIYEFSPNDSMFSGMGTHSGEVDNNDKIKKVSIANDKFDKSHGKGWSKNHPEPQASPDPDSNSNNPESSNETANSSNEIPDPSNEIPVPSNEIPDPSNNNPDSNNDTPDSNNDNPDYNNDNPESNNDTPDANNSNSEPSADYLKVQQWLDAKVTLADGIMYEIIDQLHHDKNAFTEGLCFVDGRLFESTGLVGESYLKELDPETGDVIKEWPLHKEDFGEGLAFVDGSFFQLTYRQHKGYKYNINKLSARPEEFEFESTTGEGWGLTYDPVANELIESDGSNFLHFWDPVTMKQKRKVQVHRMDGQKAKNINELEMWRGRVLANVWFQDIILVINPKTGVVEKEYDFSKLWDKSVRSHAGADVLNGISVSDDDDILYVTGKYWDRMFKIRLLP